MSKFPYFATIPTLNGKVVIFVMEYSNNSMPGNIKMKLINAVQLNGKSTEICHLLYRFECDVEKIEL